MRWGDEVWDVGFDLGEGFLVMDYYDLMMLRREFVMSSVLGTEAGLAL